MIFTISLVTLTLVWHVRRTGVARGILHPFTWVCLFHLFYFHSAPTDKDMCLVVDLAVCLTFILFSVAMLICHGKLLRFSHRFMNYLWRGGSLLTPMRSWQVICLALLPLIFSATFVYVRIVQTGSLENALFGFYAVHRDAEALWLSRLLAPLLAMGLSALVLLRIEALVSGKTSIGVLALSLSIVMMLVLATRGARGGVLAVPVSLLLADACVNVRFAKGFRIRKGFLAVGVVGLSLGILLTILRSSSYDDFAELSSRVKNLSVSEYRNEGVAGFSQDARTTEMIAFCFEYYGRKSPFLYGHTPWCIAVNLIPREFWPNKPVGFGKLLADDNGYDPDSPVALAAGLAGEGWANGGLAGIVGLSLVIGVICGIASGLGYGMLQYGGRVHIVCGVLFLQFASFFVRGCMLSAWSYLYKMVPILLLIFIASEFRSMASRLSSGDVTPPSRLHT